MIDDVSEGALLNILVIWLCSILKNGNNVNKKIAKYTKNSNFFSYLVYRIGKDDASGLAAQMTYHFVLAMFPMLIFLLTLTKLLRSNRQIVSHHLSSSLHRQ
jgi:uncharacterized BrkB/YihY/UPF0761 family membrane protein